MLNKTTALYFLRLQKFILRFSLREANSCVSSAIQTLSVEAPLVSVLCLWPFNTARLLQPVPGSRSLRRKADKRERSEWKKIEGGFRKAPSQDPPQFSFAYARLLFALMTESLERQRLLKRSSSILDLSHVFRSLAGKNARKQHR